jgi:23S rRNA A2030 N6-methylase RlmJ
VNPPFGFDATARAILAWLWPALSQDGEGGQRVAWLAPE